MELWNIEKIMQAGGIGVVLYPDGFDKFKELIYKLKEGDRDAGFS